MRAKLFLYYIALSIKYLNKTPNIIILNLSLSNTIKNNVSANIDNTIHNTSFLSNIVSVCFLYN